MSAVDSKSVCCLVAGLSDPDVCCLVAGLCDPDVCCLVAGLSDPDVCAVWLQGCLILMSVLSCCRAV